MDAIYANKMRSTSRYECGDVETVASEKVRRGVGRGRNTNRRGEVVETPWLGPSIRSVRATRSSLSRSPCYDAVEKKEWTGGGGRQTARSATSRFDSEPGGRSGRRETGTDDGERSRGENCRGTAEKIRATTAWRRDARRFRSAKLPPPSPTLVDELDRRTTTTTVRTTVPRPPHRSAGKI